MLDAPDASARAQWLVGLYFGLRSRGKWGDPLPFSEIDGYLRMRGYPTAELYDRFVVADAAAVEWMSEQTKRERQSHLSARVPHGGRQARH